MPPPKPCSRRIGALVVLVRMPIVVQRRRIDVGRLVGGILPRRRLPRADCVRGHDLCSQDLPIIASAPARPGARDLLVVRMLLQQLFGVVTAFRFPWHGRAPFRFPARRRSSALRIIERYRFIYIARLPRRVNTYETTPFRLFTSGAGCA